MTATTGRPRATTGYRYLIHNGTSVRRCTPASQPKGAELLLQLLRPLSVGRCTRLVAERILGRGAADVCIGINMRESDGFVIVFNSPVVLPERPMRFVRASALSKTDPPMLSKSDPGNLNLTPPTGSARDDDDESSRCQRLGRNHAESAAGGSGRIRE